MTQSVGILGAGKLGLVLAQLAVRAGLEVNIAGSRQPEQIALTIDVLAPGAQALSSAEVIDKSDIIILALPLGKYKSLPKDGLKDKLIIDAMNYWWEVDGIRKEFDDVSRSTSEMIRDYLGSSRLFKAFSHMGYHDLLDNSAPAGTPNRKAIAFAGDNKEDAPVIANIIDILGFDALYIGSLVNGIKLQPGNDAFGANIQKDELVQLLKKFDGRTDN